MPLRISFIQPLCRVYPSFIQPIHNSSNLTSINHLPRLYPTSTNLLPILPNLSFNPLLIRHPLSKLFPVSTRPFSNCCVPCHALHPRTFFPSFLHCPTYIQPHPPFSHPIQHLHPLSTLYLACIPLYPTCILVPSLYPASITTWSLLHREIC